MRKKEKFNREKKEIIYKNGLSKDDYIKVLKDCGMTTKKWTIAKFKAFRQRKAELMAAKANNL